jgi:hypothetical protein
VARSKKTAVAVAAGVLALGAGIGVASYASADPTPTPSGTPSAGQPSHDPNGRPGGPGGPGRGPRGHGGPGAFQDDLAKSLASKLGVDEAKVTEALKAIREADRPKPGATPPATRPDPTARDAALAKALAAKLGIDEAKVTKALAEIRSEHQVERATALKDRLDAAVKAGTLTQAEADAVTKAVEKGVINVGPR